MNESDLLPVWNPFEDEPSQPAVEKPQTEVPPTAKPVNKFAVKVFAHNEFTDKAARELTLAEQSVWDTLHRDSRVVGNEILATTAQTDIARRKGLSVRHVKRCLKRLVAKGFLDIIRKGRINQAPTTYRLHSRARETK